MISKLIGMVMGTMIFLILVGFILSLGNKLLEILV